MLIKTQHAKRLIQPLPLFAVAIGQKLNFDIEMSIPKKYHLNQKGTVPKMKLTTKEGKEATEAIKEKIKTHIPKYPTLEFKSGYIQVKAEKK